MSGGNQFAVVIRADSGQILKLVPLDPAKVKVRREGGRMVYYVDGGYYGGEVSAELQAEINQLRAALWLAAAEVFGHCDPLTTSPDQLVEHFIKEARRG